ncbi:MAG: protein-L-isoaspartate(D-aspartate) O-methyltransferase [Deltaproteobacteria bacterium]|jgi:protein-L-isoaspartate(D-aspartate) O-methyltransferase|nr:protein-L-isoaspartate(D-aspartate) O-methyltransferase [Deltaproteobacteria bacterium]
MALFGFKPDMTRSREAMVNEQLAARGITDPRVLEVMGFVPRHLFVDEAMSPQAYADGPLPIGHGQFISQPYMVAAMTQRLRLRPDDRVLEIGSGCGYQTAILSYLCKTVYAVEILSPLRDKSVRTLTGLGITNAHIKLADGRMGWPEFAPFNAILVAAYSETLPKILYNQLAVGGRMIIPLGPEVNQRLVLITKDPDGGQSRKILEGCRFVPLVYAKEANRRG